MRDFRDAKAMAQTLRDSLHTKAVSISHSESLELVSKMLGVADWNTLSALLKVDSGKDRNRPMRQLNGPASYPAIPIRDLVPFPTMIYPLFVGREKTMRALERAFEQQREIVLAVQKDSAVDEPGFDDIYDVGALARLLEVERLPDGTMKALVEVQRRVRISRFIGEPGAFQTEVADVDEGAILDAPEPIGRAVERFKSYAAVRNIPVRQTWPALDQMHDPGRLADIIAQHMVLPVRDKQALLSTVDGLARLERAEALMASASEPARATELAMTLDRALALANQRRHAYATLEHLLLALTDDKDAARMMEACGVNRDVLRENLVHYVDTAFDQQDEGSAEAKPTAAFQRVARRAEIQAIASNHPAMTGADYLWGLFAEQQSPAVRLLAQQKMTGNDAGNYIAHGMGKQR